MPLLYENRAVFLRKLLRTSQSSNLYPVEFPQLKRSFHVENRLPISLAHVDMDQPVVGAVNFFVVSLL